MSIFWILANFSPSTWGISYFFYTSDRRCQKKLTKNFNFKNWSVFSRWIIFGLCCFKTNSLSNIFSQIISTILFQNWRCIIFLEESIASIGALSYIISLFWNNFQLINYLLTILIYKWCLLKRLCLLYHVQKKKETFRRNHFQIW